MINSAKVSIVVPIYEVEDYLPQCIESILNQKYKNIEIILVNDGSKDNCQEIINFYAKLDERIIVISKKNGGLVSARKAGVEAASGKYITFVDGDDWIEVSHIKNLIGVELNGIDLVICGFKRDFLGKRKELTSNFDTGRYNYDEIKNQILPKAIYDDENSEHGISTYVWNKLFIREKLKEHIYKINNEIVMGEDSCLTYPYIFCSKNIYITNQTTYIYRQRASSIIKSVADKKEEYKRMSLVFTHLLDALDHIKPFDNIYDQLKKYFFSIICMRSGGIFSFDDVNYHIPFSNFDHKVDTKVAIFSSGSFGQHLHSEILCLPNIKIVGWFDEDFKESRQEGLDVSAPKEIQFFEFDKILVASLNKSRINEIIEQLKVLGISDKKISTIKKFDNEYEHALQKLGFNLEDFRYLEG